jgi:hypothetical protein
MLADVERPDLTLVKNRAELSICRRTAAEPGAPQFSGDLDPLEIRKATENEAATREALNILSDLVDLTKSTQMAQVEKVK